MPQWTVLDETNRHTTVGTATHTSEERSARNTVVASRSTSVVALASGVIRPTVTLYSRPARTVPPLGPPSGPLPSAPLTYDQ